MTFDTTQKVVGIGSWKFDSDDGSTAKIAKRTEVLGASRRISFYWRYDSVPDKTVTVSEFVGATAGTAYSGGGFDFSGGFLDSDDATYATATPAKNSGQGTVWSAALIGDLTTEIPIGAVIDSVKIIYERKYDTATSIGISRVKYRIDGVEGPDHDSTAQPLTDTVVTEDVTADRAWTWQDFQSGVFELIAEARRGDTDTAHTQSWDYVKVEVVYHLAAGIFRAMPVDGLQGFHVAVTPKGSGVVLRFVDGAGAGYDGTTLLSVDTWYRIGISYLHHATDDLDIKIYVDSVQELSIVTASTNGESDLANLEYGWTVSPGVDHLSWFDQIYIDEGDDLTDTGNKLMTAKLPAAVNSNEWDTDGGTGAINERPLSQTNYKQDTAFSGSSRQTYTLQTAATGDVDLSGETIVGYMAWAWAEVEIGSDDGQIQLVVNGVDKRQGVGFGGYHSLLTSTPSLIYYPTISDTYPSDASGIGMGIVNPEDMTQVVFYEGGVVVAYEGPPNPSDLLPYQTLNQGTTTPASQDQGETPPASYNLRSQVDTGVGSLVTTTIFASNGEGEVPQQLAVIESSDGDSIGFTRVAPGQELSASIAVSGASANVELRQAG